MKDPENRVFGVRPIDGHDGQSIGISPDKLDTSNASWNLLRRKTPG